MPSRPIHRPWVKRGDLIVVQIGDDEGLRRKRARDLAHALARDAEGCKPFGVGSAIVADGRHHHRLASQHLEVIGNVAGAAAPFAAHFTNLERHREHVRLFGKDVPREPIREHHDGVERERAADQRTRGAHVEAPSVTPTSRGLFRER